jgi:large subunit ribosomal protein L24
MQTIKKNDTVRVMIGKDKGKEGSVIAILPEKGKVMVKGVAVATRHAKARKQGEASSIKKREAYIDISNVMPVCSSCKKPCRVASKEVEGGKRARVCAQCKEIF